MWEIIFRVWFFIIILPITLVQEGYGKLKKFLAKRGYEIDWIYFTLATLIIVLIILLLLGYGYR